MDTTLTTALREAYAVAPANVVIHHTLELRHSAFTTPIRVVRDFESLTATLESTAPIDASTAVLFQAFTFDFTKPDVSSTGVPQISITIDNVDRSIIANIEAALLTTEIVQVTYREFLSNDLSAPQNNPPLTMSIMSITADTFKITAKAGFPDLMNRRFPTTEYDPQIFPGLLP